MKRFWLFACSTMIALGIAYYSKTSPHASAYNKSWKTFEKKQGLKITGHKTTPNELLAARIPVPKRVPASEKDQSSRVSFDVSKDLPKDRDYQLRENRILIGDLDKNDYQDEQVDLEMVNKFNPDWKNVLGNDLLRFHQEDTKVMIKEEFPVIKIQNGKGQYLEQVVVTYLFKNGNFSSFHALIDSETGFVTETWDKTVHEKVRAERADLSLPEYNNSGIIAR